MVPMVQRARLVAALIVGTVLAAMGLTVALLAPAEAANGTIRGIVTESGTGTPLSGVSVQAFCWTVVGSDPGTLCGQTQTTADGTYALSVASGTYKVFFDDLPTHRAEFYGGGTTISDPNSLDVVVPSGGSVTGIDAALVRVRTVSGTVTSNGSLLAGINVTAYQLTGGSWLSVGSSLTGPDGRYALHLPAGTYRIGFVDASGPYQTVYFDGAQTVDAATDVVVGNVDVGDINADMGVNYPVTGRVTVDGVNMPAVTVTAWQRPDPSASWTAVKFTTTGDDGTYRLYLPDGTYRIEFRTWQGRFPTQYYDGASTLDAATDVVLAGAEVPGVDATILSQDPDSGPAITGTVTVQGSGDPVEFASVAAYRFNVLFSTWELVKQVGTGPDGTYVLRVPEGTYRIGFSHFAQRYQPTFYGGGDTVEEAADLVVPTEGVPNVDAQMVENKRIMGTITADPVPENPPGPPPTLVESLRWDADTARWGPVSTGFSTPTGEYAVYVPDGTYRLRFTPFGGPFEPTYYDGVDNVGEASDIVMNGDDVAGVDVHFSAVNFESPLPWPAASTVSAGGQDGWAPDVAVSPDGSATAVWYRRDGNHARIQATTRGANGSWSSPVNLSSPGQDGFDPQVSAGPKGTAVVVWRQWTGSNFRVLASTRTANTWSGPVTLSGSGGQAWDPQVATSALGTAVAVWRQSDANGSRIQGASLSANGRWSSPSAVSAAGGDAWDPQVAMASDGTALTTWSRFDGTSYRVQASTRAASGPWSSPRSLSAAGADAWDPQVALDAKGGAAVVWRRSDGSNDRIEAVSQPPGGTWSTPDAISAAGRNAHDPQVAVAPAGMVTAVWSRWDGSNDRVQTSSWMPGGVWSPPTTLSRPDQDGQDAQLAASPDGTATAAWRQTQGFDVFTLAAIRTPAGAWSVPSRLSQYTFPSTSPGLGTAPALSAGPDGTVAVVWERRDGGVDRVQGVVRRDAPGNHCRNGFGVDLNVLFGVPEQFVDGPCRTVTAGEAWRPLNIWTMNVGFDAAPPDFLPAGETPAQDLAAKLESVKVIIDAGTRKERSVVVPAYQALRIDRTIDEYNPGESPWPMGASLPRIEGLRAGDHTVRVIWTLSAQHCDGFTDIPEYSCLPAGDTRWASRQFTVVK